MNSCYVSWITAKTGQEIPCFTGGKPFASLYNPQKEAENFAELTNAGFILIAGFGCGLQIIETIKKHPNATLIVVEANNESINFLRDSKKINIPSNITLCTPDSLYDVLLKQYYPPMCGAFSFFPVRSWANANVHALENIQKIIQQALKAISADISVQSHFGKLWHRNILQNLAACENIAPGKLLNFANTGFPTQKIAFVAGAGPSLELWFSELQNNKGKYFIIASDTAYHALIEHNIIPDLAISVDAQHISLNHFLCDKNSKTLFAFDLCANPAVVRNVINQKKTVFFFKSGHPLCTLADEWYHGQAENTSEFFPYFSSGNGTVTLAALNFAKYAGFNTIKTGGTDFSYCKGKPYAQGTYLDTLYSIKSTKLNTLEYQFSALMFRTELIKLGNENSFTTPLLQQYKISFESFFSEQSNESVNMQKNNTITDSYSSSFYEKNFPSKKFIHWYRSNIQELIEKTDKCAENAILVSLLPYVAWYSHKNDTQIKIKKIFELGLKATIQI